ncbi:MAG TPA: dihydrolipoamide acetyltransferase family protein, partial [Actinomycetes bacterium]|nr:dihydrolipoamide acetyltransferase family protein [Actinomycetes bacterium]
EDETVQVGQELAVISEEAAADGTAPTGGRPAADDADQPEAGGGSRQRAQEESREPAGAKGEAADGRAAPSDDGGVIPEGMVLSPLVRKLVREHGVDLRQVRGTGRGGRVSRQDVLAYLERRGDQAVPAEPSRREAAGRPAAPAAGAAPVQAVPLPAGVREQVVKASRTRRIIAERMVASKRTSAHLTTAVEIDMTDVMRLRARVKDAFKAREGVGLSPLPFSVLALVAAIREFPTFNSALDEDFNHHIYADVNLGVAVDTPKGLFVPVVRGIDRMNLAGIARAIADVARRTRDGRINPDELSGSTITVTNTGSVGAVWDTPIINQPNVCILATPAIVKRPAVIDHPELGEIIAVRHLQYGILTYDHRVVDGADAARFLGKIKQVLEAADFTGELAGYERG